MNIHFRTEIARDVEIELHFTDGKVYTHKARVLPYTRNTHTVVGRGHASISTFLVKTDGYWYDHTVLITPADELTIELDGREHYTQMLRDAAMRSKPEIF